MLTMMEIQQIINVFIFIGLSDMVANSPTLKLACAEFNSSNNDNRNGI